MAGIHSSRSHHGMHSETCCQGVVLGMLTRVDVAKMLMIKSDTMPMEAVGGGISHHPIALLVSKTTALRTLLRQSIDRSGTLAHLLAAVGVALLRPLEVQVSFLAPTPALVLADLVLAHALAHLSTKCWCQGDIGKTGARGCTKNRVASSS